MCNSTRHPPNNKKVCPAHLPHACHTSITHTHAHTYAHTHTNKCRSRAHPPKRVVDPHLNVCCGHGPQLGRYGAARVESRRADVGGWWRDTDSACRRLQIGNPPGLRAATSNQGLHTVSHRSARARWRAFFFVCWGSLCCVGKGVGGCRFSSL